MNQGPTMTDSEMVEEVARKVMGFVSHDGLAWREVNDDSYLWDPFHDANDLMMVPEKFDWWKVGRNEFGYYAGIEVGEVYYREQANTLARAICEAALKAVEK